jgi:hypothetical protein
VDAGFSKIVLWEGPKKLKPHKLKISPVVVVLQKDWSAQIILDLSFPVYTKQTMGNSCSDPIQAGVNNTMVKLAQQATVQEIGNVFW